MQSKVIFMCMLSILIVGIAGCSGVSSYTPIENIGNTENIEREPPKDVTWISPAKVMIGNFHAGARAEYPITIHNGNSIQNERKVIETEVGETTASIPLNMRLHNSDLASIINLYSDNTKDNLQAQSFSNIGNSLTISGFNPADTRIMTIVFTPDTMFNVGFSYPDWAEINYRNAIKDVCDWIVVTDPTPVLAPFETRDVIVAIDMPVEAVAPMSQYEFWIIITQQQTGTVQTQLASRWIVTMR